MKNFYSISGFWISKAGRTPEFGGLYATRELAEEAFIKLTTLLDEQDYEYDLSIIEVPLYETSNEVNTLMNHFLHNMQEKIFAESLCDTINGSSHLWGIHFFKTITIMKKELTGEQLAKIKTREKEIRFRKVNEWLLSHNPELSECVKEAIYRAFYYVLTNNNTFNILPMTEEDLNTVNTEYIDLFEESRAEDGNVLIQSIQRVLDMLVEISDKETKQDIANEFMSNLKRDGF